MKSLSILLALASLATLRAIDAVAINSATEKYIIVHKPENGSLSTFSSILSTTLADVNVLHTFETIHAVSAALTKSQLHNLKTAKDIKVYPDGVIKTLDLERDPPVGLDRINQKALPLDGQYCFSDLTARVDVFVIDTGILVEHNEFKPNRAVFGANFAGDGISTDCNGHGTHTAGTIGGKTFGVAKGVHLTAVKVLDCNGVGSNTNAMAAIEWVITQHKNSATKKSVINMSLGGEFSIPLNDVVKSAVASGIHVVVAAGNKNADACESSPASASGVITVAAVDDQDSRAYFSNFGPCTDVFAPGVGILSSSIPDVDSTEIRDGTSMSCPHVAGIVAFLLQTGNFSTEDMKTTIITTATKDVVAEANGSPNLLAFIDQPC